MSRSHLINLLRPPSRRSGSLKILEDSSGALPSLGGLATVYEMASSDSWNVSSDEAIAAQRVRLGSVSAARGCLAAFSGLLAILFTVVGLGVLAFNFAKVLDALLFLAFGLLFFGRATLFLGTKAFPATIVFHPTELVLARALRPRRTIAYAELASVWVGTMTKTMQVPRVAVHEDMSTLFFGVKDGKVIALYAPDELARTAVVERVRAALVNEQSPSSRSSKNGDSVSC